MITANCYNYRLFSALLGTLALLLHVGRAQEIGIWTSTAELSSVPMTGAAWEEVLEAATTADASMATVSDQSSHNNVQILAASIAYARTGNAVYKDKVVAAANLLVAGGKPADRTLAWAREAAAYVMAADLVGYRTVSFESWLRDLAESYVASDGRTMLEMFEKRPNNWGAMGFGSLCAIYSYLGDYGRLTSIRDYWVQAVSGPKPGTLTYGSDLSWHVDESNLRLINPVGALKSGISIDGIIPDDLRRGSAFSVPPVFTGYQWEALQGIVTAARILDRAGQPIWSVGDEAIRRAVEILDVTYANSYGQEWRAQGDDSWMLPIIDQAYGTNYSANCVDPERLWKHGKIAGWGYVTLAQSNPGAAPGAPNNLQATAASGCEINLTWVDTADNENGFQIELSVDGGTSFSQFASLESDRTDYFVDGLEASTSYCFRVLAFNGVGDSDYSNVSCATTFVDACAESRVALADEAVSGSVTGSYQDTHASDNNYQILHETQSGGKPKNRYSYLEHRWVFEAPNEAATFLVEAYRTAGNEGDDFVFAYSTDGSTFTDMVEISKTADDNITQAYALPTGLSGALYVRVRDLDRSDGNRTQDSLYIDQMMLLTGAAPALPATPSDLVTVPGASCNIGLSWTDESDDETGFIVEQSTDSGITFQQVGATGENATTFVVSNLSPTSTYCYRVSASNDAGISSPSNVACAVSGNETCIVDVYASSEQSNGGSVTGNYLDTHESDDSYETLQEVSSSGGKPSRRHSLLEHEWVFDVPPGNEVLFLVEAHHSQNNESDHFDFSYSTDGSNFTSMLSVTKTADDDTEQVMLLPGAPNGKIHIRVQDTDRSTGNRQNDTLYIDRMVIRSN